MTLSLVGVCLSLWFSLLLKLRSVDFWKSELGGEVYIVCFALVGGLEGYLLTMAYRYIGDADDVPGIRRQSASRLLSLLGVLAVNPISFGLGFAIDKGSVRCRDI